VANPDVSYHCPDSHRMISGVAVRIKELLNLLNKYHIDHRSESMIRSSLDELCVSSSKQHFLHPDLVGSKISISRKDKTVCKGCAVIPKNRVPDQFFAYFSDGKSFCYNNSIHI
jgi:hypothetical protein